MKLKNKSILLISTEPWGTNFVSKHHYAVTLANRRNNVFYLNPPSESESIYEESKDLFIVNYKPKYRGLAKMPAFLSAWLIKKEISRIEKLCKSQFDIIWNFDSTSFFNLGQVGSKIRISHIVDLSEDKNIKLLNTTYDFCISTSKFIYDRQKKYNPNSHNISHGYNPIVNDEKFELQSNTKAQLKVGYVGNLLIKYLDWELVYSIVSLHPDVDFYFVGPYERSNLSRASIQPEHLIKTKALPNSYFTGPVKHFQIASILSQLDLLLLAYKADSFREQLANPHKLLEYLASGKVVLASWTEEYRNKLHLIEMVESNNQFLKKFEEIKQNIEFYNSRDKQKARINYALSNTYSSKIDMLEKIISNQK